MPWYCHCGGNVIMKKVRFCKGATFYLSYCKNCREIAWGPVESEETGECHVERKGAR